MNIYGVVLFSMVAGCVHGHLPESNYITMHDGQPSSGGELRDAVRFKRHPMSHGNRVRDAYAAFHITDDHATYFGQTRQHGDGKLCAEFNIEGRHFETCNYRILKQDSRRYHDFCLIKPEKYHPKDYELPEYKIGKKNYRMVMMYDSEEDSSFYGTQVKSDGEETAAYGTDYNSGTIEFRGGSATSGEHILFVATKGCQNAS